MYTLVDINSENYSDFSHLVTSGFSRHYNNCKFGEDSIAIGAMAFRLPIGIIFSKVLKNDNQHILYAFYVLEKYRNRGIGSDLMQACLDRAKKIGIQKIELYFNKPILPETPAKTHALIKILKNYNWNKSVLQRHTFIFNKPECLTVLQEPWINFELPSGLTLELWENLSKQEFDQLRYMDEKRAKEPDYISPFTKNYFRLDHSVCLKHGKAIVGWLIMCSISDYQILFHSMYIEKMFRGSRAFLVMLATVIKNIVSSYKQALFSVDVKNKAMFGLGRKLLEVHTTYLIENHHTLIELAES
jgi:hypothetical protein